MIGTRKSIINDKPIIGVYNVNSEGSGDMYYKGANMLHTLRQLIEDDEKWRQILRGMNKTFYHQTVNTEQIENYLSESTEIDLTAFFNQYLRDIRIPTLEYKFNDHTLKYRWINTVSDFDMPIQVTLDGKLQWLYPTNTWNTIPVNKDGLIIDPDFYVDSKTLE